MIESSPVDWILASNSPRRRELLKLLRLDFSVCPADVDENTRAGEAPPAYVLRLAEQKARAVASKLDGARVIISADTTVVDEGEILGKPRNAEDAEKMLTRLRGRSHQVLTGISVHFPQENVLINDMGVTEVPMRAYSDDEIQAYIASGDPMDKAGAYAIQHSGFHPVENLKGCYANVVGLPLCHLARTLHKAGMPLQWNVAGECQKALHYLCSIYEQVLREEL